MDEFHHGVLVAEVKVESVGLFRVKEPQFEALADKGEGGPQGDGVHGVMVGVEIRLDSPLRIVDTHVAAKSRGSLVLRTVPDALLSLQGAGLEVATGPGCCAGKGTAIQHPSGMFWVKRALYFSEWMRARFPRGRRMLTELEVVCGEDVVFVHDLVQVGGADAAHLALYVVEIVDFFVELYAYFL
jgi:hypothetical protein